MAPSWTPELEFRPFTARFLRPIHVYPLQKVDAVFPSAALDSTDSVPMEMDEDMGLTKYGSPLQRFSYVLPDESQPRIFLKLTWDRDEDGDSSSYGASDEESDEEEEERRREQEQERACRWRDALPCSTSLGSAPEWCHEPATLTGTNCVMVCGSNMGTKQEHQCKNLECGRVFKNPIHKKSGKCNACKNEDEEDDEKEEEGEPDDEEDLSKQLEQAQDGVDVARRELPGGELVCLAASTECKLLHFC